ncbi:extracellular solute-binding protein [Phyllobacterium sp. 0TCS1.6C]|uniref:extracellular solute-binding protein n=1 Tax=unclassified Phyllobacterium TaxID=2638441 RepID=UPI0022641F0F|nr:MULTISPECIES: extracellular solute-binding protein [unclassified Phyllobacterium]MCX8278678.1 extracellular solute-binding protein [Phyllobacterium sp. 0TCS1.6C]MCX8293492.1 extracellular solute-binding protein [Phyllobacterium sp. 0TCS1.6A]
MNKMISIARKGERVVVRAAAAGLALFLASAAANAQTVVKWLHLEIDPRYVAIWDDIAKKYEAEHPNVDIQMQFLENEAFKAKLPTLLQSPDAPQIFYTWGGGVLKQQSETGSLKDLTPSMKAEDAAWEKTYNPAAVQGLTFNEKIWAVPMKMGTVSFFYNKEKFAKAGVDAAGIKTWSNLLDAVKKIKSAGIVPIAGGGGEKWPLHFYWSYLVMRNGGQQVFTAAKNGEGEGFLDPAIIKAGEQLAELGALEPFQPGYLGTTWPQALGLFGDGKAAMILGFENTEANQRNNAGDGKGLNPENIGRFAFPVIEGGAGAATDTLGGLNGWAVSKDAPQEAVDFLAYLTNVDNERVMAKAGMLIPVAKGAEDGVVNPLVRQSAEQLGASTWHQNFFDQDLGPSVGRVVNDVSVEITSGQMTSEEGAQMIQDAFELEKF